jgi:oligopeptide/dipeptide ABC transporter ATP-binding protein
VSPLLSIDDLTVHFKIRRGLSRKSVDVVHAVDAVDLQIESGETLALVGESGSGKTTIARAILGLNKPTAGKIAFGGKDLAALKRKERRSAMREAQVVFQDPYSSLSPRLTVRDVIAEPLRAQTKLSGTELNDRVLELLEMVGLGTQHLWRRPHEFSGGQCQRIAVARALALQPKLIVLDEPTSALDVSVQARILVLLKELQRRLGLAYLFIAHDLAVVEAIADTVAVLYLGQIVESGPTEIVLKEPRHPYTRALLASVPSPDPQRRSELGIIKGEVPSAVRPPSGCRFHPRCPFVMDVCPQEQPELHETSGGHRLACHLADDFAFPPIMRSQGGGPPGSREREERPPSGERRPGIDEQSPLGRSMREALFGTRRRARLVPGGMVGREGKARREAP